ncbi:MAG: Macrolide export ATP-binding/permease protein MacB [Syntrophorhabdaceae bacterium PtaU1.Bin034]|jgi:putative ABC transport system permease protein|nr:MAG: Macrolide export ATP-binding/permease protein MacB [Syntrophorhabdaceae bacterium PtaU1.Bin034]
MTLKDIAFSNLRRRKAKALFVLAGLLIGVSTVVTLLTLVQAMKEDINHKLEMYGANILIVPKTENLSLTYGGLSLGGVSFDMKEIREEELGKVKTIKNASNVAALGPMVLGPVNIDSHRILMAGVDLQASHFLRPWWNLKGNTPDENEAILGSEAARISGLAKDSTIRINGQEILITGVLEPTGSQDDGLIFTPVATAQKLLGKVGKVSMAEVAALCNACPIDEMVRQISEVLPGANVMAIQQVVKGRMETLSYFQKFSYGVSALVLFVGSLMVLITMMGSVRERTVEIGIFRAMGFRRSHVMRIIFLEAGIISFVAGVLGYLVGIGATKVLAPYFMEGHHMVSVSFDPFIAGLALAASIVLGLASTTYPAMLASRLDPNEALRAL